jgi:hypothetical protein
LTTADTVQPSSLFIAGAGRSGSTLLDGIVGQASGCVAVGELNYFWEAGYGENVSCSCGQPIRECLFWRKVLERVRGSESLETFAVRCIHLESSVARRRFLPWIVWPSLRSSRYRADIAEYLIVLRSLYQAIAEISGATCVVDSSKDPSQAILLREAGIPVSVLHLVRDARAVAYSRTRVKARAEFADQKRFMPIQPVALSGVKWLVVNGLSQSLGRLRFPYLRIRYEDLVGDPVGWTQQILEFAGLPTDELTHFAGDLIKLGIHHVALGNPGKFAQTELQVRLDSSWETRQPLVQRSVVTAITAVLLMRYGYKL